MTPGDERAISDALRWIAEHFAEPITLNELASRMQMNRFRLLRLFRRATGTTPHQYIVRLRLRAAAQRLTSGNAAVTEIAYAVGFEDFRISRAAFRLSSECRLHAIARRGVRCAPAMVTPTGIETRVFAVKGRRPRPLDDGAVKARGPLSEGSCSVKRARGVVEMHFGRVAAVPLVASGSSRRATSARPGEERRACPRSVAALRNAIHLKLLPSSPQAIPRTWPSPTTPVLSRRAGPAATRGLGQPAP